jgi:hypothetical protein
VAPRDGETWPEESKQALLILNNENRAAGAAKNLSFDGGCGAGFATTPILADVFLCFFSKKNRFPVFS